MTEKCTIHRKRGPARARDGSKRGGPARTGWERAGPSQSRGAAAPARRGGRAGKQQEMSAFYCQLYSKLIPLQLGADDNAARVENDAEDARSALKRAFLRLIELRHQQGEVAPGAIDGGAESEPVRPQQDDPPLEHTPLKKSA